MRLLAAVTHVWLRLLGFRRLRRKVGDWSLVFYRKGTGGTENGSLIAPFDGIHGWYLKNDTDRPVVVRLTLAGFYEVIPNQLPN